MHRALFHPVQGLVSNKGCKLQLVERHGYHLSTVRMEKWKYSFSLTIQNGPDLLYRTHPFSCHICFIKENHSPWPKTWILLDPNCSSFLSSSGPGCVFLLFHSDFIFLSWLHIQFSYLVSCFILAEILLLCLGCPPSRNAPSKSSLL